MNLSESPHKKVEFEGTTYYITHYPEGDAHIHQSKPYDKNGYGGSVVKFLLDSGEIEEVRGPYCCDGMFDFGIGKRLAKHLDDQSLLQQATRLVVGHDLFLLTFGKKREIIFEEDEFSVGDYRERLKDEWLDYEIKVCIRGGAFYIKAGDTERR